MAENIIWTPQQVYDHLKNNNFTSIPKDTYVTKNFKWSEVVPNRVLDNTIKPEHLSNLKESTEVLQVYRDTILGGKSVTIKSGLRPLQYNRGIGSGDSSWHVTGKALDFTVDGLTDAKVQRLLSPYHKGELEFAGTWTHVGGSKRPGDIFEDSKRITPNPKAKGGFDMTEVSLKKLGAEPYNPKKHNELFNSSSKPDTPKTFKKQPNVSDANSGLSNSPSVANRLIQQQQVNPGLINLQHLANLPTPSAAYFLNAALLGVSGIFKGLGAASMIPGVGDFFTGIFGNIVEKSVSAQISNVPTLHSGGQVPGQGEILTLLKGGETVRTKAQEEELQQNLCQKYTESYTPLICGGQDDSNKESGQNAYQNKPIRQQITKDDEVFILSLISDALERNRMGLRNQVKAI